jgi:hypothetical protein
MSDHQADELPLDWREPNDSSDPNDITSRAASMPADAGILYLPRTPFGSDPPAFIGVIRVRAPGLYWAIAHYRTVRGRQVLELRLTAKS